MTTNSAFDLQKVQKARKWVVGPALLALVVLALFTTTPGGETPFHEGFESFGLGAIVFAIVGRAWCSLYIGGRKKSEIVQTGPYSISRNPLYVFSYAASFGVGAQTGSLIVALLFVIVTVVIFEMTIRREESWLRAAFGQDYLDYMAQTPRCGPDFSKWKDEERLEIRPQFFVTTLRDGLVFLLAIPIFEGIEMAQEAGWLITPIILP